MRFKTRIKNVLLGHPLNPFNPAILKHTSLVAFLAWVGLGADGLSSSCYGPEEAFIALGGHTHFALYIAIATALTVFLISLAYNQVIELFPSGGGGYKVSTQLLGPYAGLVSGAALIIDYVLTIAVSTASGMDAIFSLLPVALLSYKLLAEAVLILFLIILNMRGMKESIKILMPIFLGFILVHFTLIIYGISAHRSGIFPVMHETVQETNIFIHSLGWLPFLALVLHAYSLGGGTYTGLEAVSNNVNRLREPRVVTGKWTMLYMATSLSFTAAGFILLYLLWQPLPTLGQTLNAIVFQTILGNSYFGHLALLLTLLLEASLLFVGANTGFLAGPTVLANMAIDSWMPNRFRHLSTRLVIQNGVILFGLAALGILIWCKGAVSVLVVLYSINVFITFTLSLLGMSMYWIRKKQAASPNWRWRLIFSFTAFLITGSILIITLLSKLQAGGWLTLTITSAVIAFCLLIKQHYKRVAKKLAVFDVQLKQPLIDNPLTPPLPDPQQPTAGILVGKNLGVGMHTLLCVLRMFPHHYKNFVFLSVGIVDVQSFSGPHELEKMKQEVNETLDYFIKYCNQYGIPAKAYTAFGTDTVEELDKLTEIVCQQFPNCIFFSSKLVFKHDNWITRFLHNETPNTLQRHLHIEGKELVIIPMRI
ncbi:MAG TPA: APC family permease [Gammaproteobacteria bacterium]|nr:APC family permease [Gammaproteobacteria bacterium]